MAWFFFFFQAEDGIRDYKVTGVQTCALPIFERGAADLGVCGIDQVLESAADLLTPIDFGFGRCRLCLAAPGGKSVTAGLGRSLRGATQDPRLSSQWFGRRGVPVDPRLVSGAV